MTEDSQDRTFHRIQKRTADIADELLKEGRRRLDEGDIEAAEETAEQMDALTQISLDLSRHHRPQKAEEKKVKP